jgi:hypothetical protein
MPCHPEKVTEPKHNGFSEKAPKGLLNPDDTFLFLFFVYSILEVIFYSELIIIIIIIIFLPITSSSHFNIFYLMENYIPYMTHGMLMLLLTTDPDLFGLDGGGWCCFLHI